MKDWYKIFLLTSSTRLISPANARECRLEMLHFLKEKYFSSISKCCTSWKKSISQVFPNVALSERKVFRALAIGRDWIRENIFVPMQTFMTAEAKTFAGNLFRTSNCGGMEPRMAGCSLGCGHWVCMQEKLSKGGSLHVLHVSYYMHNSCSKADMSTEGSSSCTNFFSVCMMLCAVVREDSLWIP